MQHHRTSPASRLRRALIAAALGASLAGAFSTADAVTTPADLRELMQKNALAFKVIGSDSRATFTLTNKDGQQRVRTTMATTKLKPNGVDYMRLTRFLAPADVKGTVSLMIENATGDDAIWIYLPALKKVRRLASSNMKDSFVGTDFSIADVIGYKLDDWRYTLVRQDTVDGAACDVVEALPRSDAVKADTGYSRRLHWIRKDNLMTVKSEFWDESGQPLKTAAYSDLQLVDAQRGRWQAMQMDAENLQTGHRTRIKVEGFQVNPQVSDDLFTARSLERE